jgi:hypothetical protein
MVLPLVLLAGSAIGGLGLQWWGQKSQYKMEKQKLEQMQKKVIASQTKTILMVAVAGALIYLLFFRKNKKKG